MGWVWIGGRAGSRTRIHRLEGERPDPLDDAAMWGPRPDSNWHDPVTVSRLGNETGTGTSLCKQIRFPERVVAQKPMLSVNANLNRLPWQRHPGLLWGSVCLLVVARLAARHEVLPRALTAARLRLDVIQCQHLRQKRASAVLAGVAIPEHDVLARNRSVLPGNLSVNQQSQEERCVWCACPDLNRE